MAGGSLIGKIHKAFSELASVGLVDATPRARSTAPRRPAAIRSPTRSRTAGSTHRPVRKPNTIAKSLAIGDPADGYFAAKVIRETGGWAEDVSDTEIAEAMTLLARTEGIFAETAGGVTVAVTRKLIEQGRIPRDEEIVICITGNGLKTQDAVGDQLEEPHVINPAGRVRAAGGRAVLVLSTGMMWSSDGESRVVVGDPGRRSGSGRSAAFVRVLSRFLRT